VRLKNVYLHLFVLYTIALTLYIYMNVLWLCWRTCFMYFNMFMYTCNKYFVIKVEAIGNVMSYLLTLARLM